VWIVFEGFEDPQKRVPWLGLLSSGQHGWSRQKLRSQ
jgi:hypothetical protein